MPLAHLLGWVLAQRTEASGGVALHYAMSCQGRGGGNLPLSTALPGRLCGEQEGDLKARQ